MRVTVLLVIGMLLAGCAGAGAGAQDAPTPTIQLPTPTSLPTAQPTQATVEATLQTTFNLTIWWPEPLSPVDRADVTELLSLQIEAFDRDEEGSVNVEFRLKRPQDVGGVMQTLRTASEVAPGALPDITLMRREDMLAAAEDGLIFPLEGLIPSVILGDLYGSALSLGQYEGQMYGLPYTLNTRLLGYRSPAPLSSTLDWSFQGVTSNHLTWVFPAGRTTGAIDTLYLQYLDAGGTPPNPDGTFELNADALLNILTFYQDGGATSAVFDYSTFNDYLQDLTAGRIMAGVIDSNTYLRLRADRVSLRAASIPTASGEPITSLNGWMWVITTSNTDQQRLAARFMAWMMDIERQREYSETIYMLPSQRSALQNANRNLFDVEVMDAMLQNATLIGNNMNTLARTIQNGLTLVLADAMPAPEAVITVADALEN